jgi:DHA2 family multidrug resistance protein
VILAGVAVFAIVMFVVHELVTEKPVVSLRVLSNRSFATGTVIGAVLGAVLFSTIFLLPLYMQEFLGYNATQTGLALMPRSLIMLVAMPIIGGIYNRVSPRAVIAFGLLLGGFSCIMMSRFTLQTSAAQILVPQLLQGVALACIFIPLSTVALATIDRARMSEATGLNNLVRQLGGSFGVAIFASLLGRFSHQAKAAVGAHLTLGDPAVYTRVEMMTRAFMARGEDRLTATQTAMRALDFQVSGQASMLGFERTFFIGGLLFLGAVPLVLMLDDARGKRPAAAGEEGHMAVEV